MTALQTFDFAPGLALRSLTMQEEPWFILKDVCDALSIRTDNAIRGLDDDEMANTQFEGFARGALIVNESGLYSLIMRSRKPVARAFKRWVTGTVLPTLRRDGLYIAGQEQPLPEDITEGDLLARMEVIQDRLDAIKAAKLAEFKALAKERRDDRYYALRAMRRSPGRATLLALQPSKKGT